ncbi:MAG: 30S ribosomal protein S18 [Chitinophagaceae bacterium]
MSPAPNTDVKYLRAIRLEKKQKKYCRFKKIGINYIDYKDPEFLKRFVNEQGKILPRRLTGNSLKFQKKVAQAIKKARAMALMPFVTDLYK